MNTQKLSAAQRLLVTLPIAALALSVAACGSAPRPTADQVADGLSQYFEDQGVGGMFDDDAAMCIAEVFVDSDLSNATLDSIAKGEDKQVGSDERDLLETVLQENATDCIS